MQFTIPSHHQQQRQTREVTSMVLTKMFVTILILMITVANRPTLIFLTNTTSTVNAFTTTLPTLTKEALMSNMKSRGQNTMTSLQQRSSDMSEMEPTLVSRVHQNVLPVHSHTVSRKSAIRSVLLFGLMSYTTSPFIATATAAENTSTAAAAMAGTKQDPKYEACLSKCMYDCTKPKGMEQKSRAVCLPECKAQCATTKQQLMIGTPIK